MLILLSYTYSHCFRKRPEKPAANDIMSRMAGMSIAKNAAANISLPILCGGAQTSMPAACTKIELRNNAEIGRHLVATEDIRPGTVSREKF